MSVICYKLQVFLSPQKADAIVLLLQIITILSKPSDCQILRAIAEYREYHHGNIFPFFPPSQLWLQKCCTEAKYKQQSIARVQSNPPDET